MGSSIGKLELHSNCFNTKYKKNYIYKIYFIPGLKGNLANLSEF